METDTLALRVRSETRTGRSRGCLLRSRVPRSWSRMVRSSLAGVGTAEARAAFSASSRSVDPSPVRPARGTPSPIRSTLESAGHGDRSDADTGGVGRVRQRIVLRAAPPKRWPLYTMAGKVKNRAFSPSVDPHISGSRARYCENRRYNILYNILYTYRRKPDHIAYKIFARPLRGSSAESVPASRPHRSRRPPSPGIAQRGRRRVRGGYAVANRLRDRGV